MAAAVAVAAVAEAPLTGGIGHIATSVRAAASWPGVCSGSGGGIVSVHSGHRHGLVRPPGAAILWFLYVHI